MLFIRVITVIVLTTLFLPAEAKATRTILVFGDSIVAGYGLSEEDALPAQLQAILREKDASITVINGGVSGDTTSGGRGRLNWTLDKHQPDLVILALGGNDVLRGTRPSATKQNIEAMLELLDQRGIKTILSAVEAPANLGPLYRRQFNALYEDAADAYDIPLYPFLLRDTYGQQALMLPDGIHPNAKGAALIARNLAALLEDELDL